MRTSGGGSTYSWSQLSSPWLPGAPRHPVTPPTDSSIFPLPPISASRRCSTVTKHSQMTLSIVLLFSAVQDKVSETHSGLIALVWIPCRGRGYDARGLSPGWLEWKLCSCLWIHNKHNSLSVWWGIIWLECQILPRTPTVVLTNFFFQTCDFKYSRI